MHLLYTFRLKMKKDWRVFERYCFSLSAFSVSIRGNSILWYTTDGGGGERPLRKVIPVRENAPAGFDACRCVILISRTRRRNARPHPRSFRKVDVLMMSTVRPALGYATRSSIDSAIQPPRQDPALPPLYCFGTVNYCVSFTRDTWSLANG